MKYFLSWVKLLLLDKYLTLQSNVKCQSSGDTTSGILSSVRTGLAGGNLLRRSQCKKKYHSLSFEASQYSFHGAYGGGGGGFC